MNVLIIIPARGGSKGIPRKNLRPLANKPLLYYSIKNALHSKFNADVSVSTDDHEICFFSQKMGAEVHMRNADLANDSATLDPVIYDAYLAIKSRTQKEYDLIVTLQPTSPLLNNKSLDGAIATMLEQPDVDTIISAVNDTHLTWREENGQYFPNYEKRVNRQYLPPVFKETGGFLITRNTVISPERRIGKNVQLYLVSQKESIDIDSYEDWQLCEYYLKKKSILFRVSGYKEIGLGHIYNCLILANDILNHKVYFLVDSKSQLGYEKIAASNYEVHIQKHKDIVDDIVELCPDVVINDCLDNTEEYIRKLKERNFGVVNFEDLGEGAKIADLVINAIYPEKEAYPNHYYGPEYFCAREEFTLSRSITIHENIKNVLLTFGGVDPNNLTYKVLAAIYKYCVGNNITINVIVGIGYENFDTLTAFENANILSDIKNISEYMQKADIAFSSAGRTTYELALLGIPSIILAQNEREMTHFFANKSNGFVNLGLGEQIKEEVILNTFVDLLQDKDLRISMSKLMLGSNIGNGKNKVIKLINKLIDKE